MCTEKPMASELSNAETVSTLRWDITIAINTLTLMKEGLIQNLYPSSGSLTVLKMYVDDIERLIRVKE